MRTIAVLVSVGLLLGFAGAEAYAQKPDPKDKGKGKKETKPDYAKLIVGTWLGTGEVEGFILVFKDGKITETDTQDKNGKPRSGPYMIKDKTMTSTLGKSTQDQEII